MTTNSSLDNMINALGLEIEAIKKSGGSSVLEIMGGELKGESGGNYLYAFQVLENIYLRDDSPIKCVIGKEEVTGYVVSFGNGILIIALEKNVGLKIPFGRLISDDSFLIERLKEKLEEVLTDTSYFSHEKALQAIGDSTFKSGENKVDQKTIKGSPYLNSEQISAVSKSLGSEITFIWGPPGTGKTTVLARVVESFYRQDLSILIVSNTNIAVDTALEKISDRLNTESGFQLGAVIRFGPVIK